MHHGCFPSMSSMWDYSRIPYVIAVSHLRQVCGTVIGYHTSWLFAIYVKYVGLVGYHTSWLFPIYVKYVGLVGYHTSWLFPIYVKYVGL